jgi:hypothetical protein
LVVSTVALFFSGCVTHITSDVYQNPPPAEKLSDFNRFELKPVRLLPPYAGQEANEAALVKIQQNIDLKMKPALEAWNAAAVSTTPVRTLLIEPIIPEIKFISGGNRFWGGALAGSSAVKLNVRLTVKETEKVVASPEFYARAAAMGGAYTFGGTDNAMLVRIAKRLSDYLVANYQNAVGGPSGAEPSSK